MARLMKIDIGKESPDEYGDDEPEHFIAEDFPFYVAMLHEGQEWDTMARFSEEATMRFFANHLKLTHPDIEVIDNV